ncbi:MAG: CaiB/BaiF CoA transferase family protein [Burkholderiaceae bacterium]
MTTDTAERSGPLSDVKVLDLSNFLAAPMCGMLLADLGADVLKVERPGSGDEMRYWGENRDGVGLYHKVINRGKKSVTLDLRTPFGVDAVKRLVKEYDVVLENYRTGTLEKWGIGYEQLREINPRLIMLRITGFGQTGPYAHRPGFGTLAEAYAGYAYITGQPGEAPMLPGFGLADSSTGVMGAYLAMAAVNERHRSGLGQYIDLAIYESMMTMIGPYIINYDQLGIVQERSGSRLPFTAPRNTYRTRDNQWLTIGGSSQSAFTNICKVLGMSEIVDDPRFLDNRLRIKNVDALDAEIQKRVEQYDLAELLKKAEENNATFAPINSVAQIFDDKHITERGNIAPVFDEELNDTLRMQNVVGRFSRTPGSIRAPGPRMGNGNREILIDKLGFSEEQLKAAGIAPDPSNP